MTPKQVAAWTLVGALAAAWFASAAGVIGPPRRPPRAAMRAQSSATDPVAFDVHAQADRLRKRLATAPAPRPVRNPFVFAPRSPVPARVAPRVAPPPPSPVPVDVEPALTLIGLAEDGAGEAMVRTAMIADAGDQLFVVKVGQTVAGRYRVSAIGADAVELIDATTGLARRLVLR